MPAARTASAREAPSSTSARATGAALVLPYVNTGATGLHLAEIARHVTPGAHAVVALDGAGWHAAADLVVPDNLTLLPLPS